MSVCFHFLLSQFGRNIESITMVYDCEGLGMKHLYKPAIETYGEVCILKICFLIINIQFGSFSCIRLIFMSSMFFHRFSLCLKITIQRDSRGYLSLKVNSIFQTLSVINLEYLHTQELFNKQMHILHVTDIPLLKSESQDCFCCSTQTVSCGLQSGETFFE